MMPQQHCDRPSRIIIDYTSQERSIFADEMRKISSFILSLVDLDLTLK